MLSKRFFMLSALTVVLSSVGMMEKVSGRSGHTFTPTLTCQEYGEDRLLCDLARDSIGSKNLASANGYPQNYVQLPGDHLLGTKDFCVMAFEAKKLNGVATSRARGKPWTKINAREAYNACRKVKTSGHRRELALTSNSEWMTIARNKVSGRSGHTFTLTLTCQEYGEDRLLCDLARDSIGSKNPASANGCPQNYVQVPGDHLLGTKDFCVMAFEAKKLNGVATSRARGKPWTKINAREAYNACRKVKTSGHRGEFALISNPEWMTIARNIENHDTNWSGGKVGVGMIPRGHSDGNPWGRQAVSDTDNFWSDTDNEPDEGWEQKRAHILSNNSVIWDLAGNAWEWVDWRGGDRKFTLGPTDIRAGSRWRELDAIPAHSVLSYRDLSPEGPYTSEEGMGRWYGGSGSAALRGGSWLIWDNYASAGVYSLDLEDPPRHTGTSVGFRCVFRPK